MSFIVIPETWMLSPTHILRAQLATTSHQNPVQQSCHWISKYFIILRSGRTGVSLLSFRTNGPLAKYFCRPALRDSVRMLTVFQQKLYSIFFITSPLPSKKKTLLQRRMVFDYPSHHCQPFHFSNYNIVVVIISSENWRRFLFWQFRQLLFFRKWTQNFPASSTIRSWSKCLHTSKEY